LFILSNILYQWQVNQQYTLQVAEAHSSLDKN